jgi:hypothetical protein
MLAVAMHRLSKRGAMSLRGHDFAVNMLAVSLRSLSKDGTGTRKVTFG